MREILFRGKRVDYGTWIEGHYVFNFWGKQEHTIHACGIGDGGCCCWVDPQTVGQFTGRLDKNGKRVFEGDIIRLCEGLPGYDVGVILWNNHDQAYVIVQNPAENVMLEDFGNYGKEEYYEVIGNIYDNPELLEVCNGNA